MQLPYTQIALVFSVFICSCTKPSGGIKPRVSNITESVYASGMVKAVDQYSVYPLVTGIVQEIRVRPGDTVKRGQLLFVLDDNTSALNTESARLSLELSETLGSHFSDRLKEAEIRMHQAKAKYAVDSSLYIRQKRLWDQHIGTRFEYDQQTLALIASRSDYQIAARQYRQLKLSLNNEVEKARVNYRISKRIEENYTIRSAISGRIFDVLVEQGELVSSQTPMAVMGRPDQFLLELQVDENDVAQISVRQKVEITMDSYVGHVFEGEIVRIYPIMNKQSRTFQVDAAFLRPPPRLYPNLTAEANIVIRAKKNALILPRSYVDNENNVWVGKNKKKRVSTGLRDYKKIEITGGLDTADIIYKPEQ